MKNLLIEIKKVDLSWNTANALTLDKVKDFENIYSQILEDGFNEDYIINIESYSKRNQRKALALIY